MSKEHLNYLRRKTADEAELWAADRIEELERELSEPVILSEWQQLLQEREQLASAQARIKQLELAIDNEMVTTHLGVFNPGDDPVKAIKDLMLWSQGVGEYFAKEQAQPREAELIAHVERLRYALQFDGFTPSDALHRKIVQDALSATPEQSLARYHNEVLEKAAARFDEYNDYAAKIIRNMKEPT